MKYLVNQVMFEEMLGLQELTQASEPVPPIVLVYFTASWCGACRSINTDYIEKSLPQVTLYKCDVDQNTYTNGYCGIRSIPAFLVVRDKKILGKFQGNDNEKIIDWVKSLLS